MKKNAFSLTEMMVVLFIFVVLFAAIFTVLTSSDRSWRIGQNKLIEQQEARKAMAELTRLLRQSNPEWVDTEGNAYPVSISSGSRIDFYIPGFTEDGELSSFRKVTFKLNPVDPRQLLKKEGTADAQVVAQEIDNLYFGGGCPGCSAFNCSTIADDCPQVRVALRTKKQSDYDLDAKITLRNINMIISDEIEIEQPEEGEF